MIHICLVPLIKEARHFSQPGTLHAPGTNLAFTPSLLTPVDPTPALRAHHPGDFGAPRPLAAALHKKEALSNLSARSTPCASQVEASGPSSGHASLYSEQEVADDSIKAHHIPAASESIPQPASPRHPSLLPVPSSSLPKDAIKLLSDSENSEVSSEVPVTPLSISDTEAANLAEQEILPPQRPLSQLAPDLVHPSAEQVPTAEGIVKKQPGGSARTLDQQASAKQ